jgi:protein-disulfide isomerase
MRHSLFRDTAPDSNRSGENRGRINESKPAETLSRQPKGNVVHQHQTRNLSIAILGLLLLAPTCWAAGTRQGKAQAKPAAAQKETPPDKGLGSRGAPIVMEVFSDYSCPMCKSFYMGAVRRLLESYVPEGKVYIIHRDFPLKGVLGHEHSREAARYANAAACIGRFREVDSALYERQEVWSRDGSVDATVAAALTPSEMTRVRALVASGKLDSYIDSDYNLGGLKGVRSTPSIYITAHGRNPESLPGTISYNLLKRYIDEQLQ